MFSKKVNGRWLVRIERGEEIVETLTQFLKEHTITAGSITGIGAVDRAELRYYSMEDKAYHNREFIGEYEILALNGNISVLESGIWPHIHIVLSDTEFHCLGGHLDSAMVSVTCEVMIDPIDLHLQRDFDDETGLNLWTLCAIEAHT